MDVLDWDDADDWMDAFSRLQYTRRDDHHFRDIKDRPAVMATGKRMVEIEDSVKKQLREMGYEFVMGTTSISNIYINHDLPRPEGGPHCLVMTVGKYEGG